MVDSGALMAITVKLPTQLRDAAGGAASLQADGSTVGEALESVVAEHGELRERLFHDGDLRRFVNVYVDGEDVRFAEGLATAVPGGAQVQVLPSVAGG